MASRCSALVNGIGTIVSWLPPDSGRFLRPTSVVAQCPNQTVRRVARAGHSADTRPPIDCRADPDEPFGPAVRVTQAGGDDPPAVRDLPGEAGDDGVVVRAHLNGECGHDCVCVGWGLVVGDIGFDEFDVHDAVVVGALTGLLEHAWRDIDADDRAGRSDSFGEALQVPAGSGAEVHHGVTRL